MQRELEIRIADGKSVRLDVKRSTVADFASAFLDDAVARVRKAAAAGRITDVEMLAEGFLEVLNERVTYFLAHIKPAERDLLLEWLVTAIIGGYGQDFLKRYISLLAEGGSPGEGPTGPGGRS